MFIDQMFCEHANECPNVCPCPANCECKTSMCDNMNTLIILKKEVGLKRNDGTELEITAFWPDDSGRPVNYGAIVHSTFNGESTWGSTIGVFDTAGNFTLAKTKLAKLWRDSWSGFDKFIEEVGRIVMVGSIMKS